MVIPIIQDDKLSTLTMNDQDSRVRIYRLEQRIQRT
jgi:hypothetical protein